MMVRAARGGCGLKGGIATDFFNRNRLTQTELTSSLGGRERDREEAVDLRDECAEWLSHLRP